MAKPNNSILTNQEELSIQISLSGLSFCALQRSTKTVSFLKHFNSEKKLTPFELLDQLKNVFNSEESLQKDFGSIQVIHTNELSTIIPKSLFNEGNLADYLKFNSKILKSDFITFDDIETNESVNVYVPYVNINNFIYDKFGEFTYKHYSTILVNQILQLEKNSENAKIYINVDKNSFEIIAIQNGNLLLYNTFEYTTKEDFIYYILFAIEQLNFNPETINLVLLGAVLKDDDLYKIAYKYVRHVSFGSRLDSYVYNQTPESSHSDYVLIKSF